MFARVWVTGDPTSTVLCQCGDPGQAVWFMAWVPYALTHAHNPLFTTRMLSGQGGANLLQSTSYLLPSFLLSPITWLFGATASFNVAETIAPILSGWAMYLAAGRVTTRWLPRAAAAVFWAFSPHIVGSEIYGHLNFTWMYFPPLLFLCVYELVVGKRLKPVTTGVLLGALVVAQFFTGTEPLLTTTMVAAVGLACALAMAPKTAWAARKRILTGFGVAVGVAVVVLAYPLWYLTTGPRHVIGSPWPAINNLGNQLSAIVRPGNGVHSTSVFTEIGGYFGPAGPSGAFLGVWLLVFLAASIPLFVFLRRKIALPLLVSGAVSWLCSLGAFLTPISVNSVHWWLPWRYINSWPLIDKIGPQRFVFMTAACAVMLLALALDCWVTVLAPPANRLRLHPRAIKAGTSVILLAIVVVVGLPVAESYTFPLTMLSEQVPVWFRTTARTLPPQTSVLTYPYASSAAPDAMYWQAYDGLSFALVGGRALIPGADGKHSQHVDPLHGTDALLTNASWGYGAPPVPSKAQVRELRSSLHTWRVDIVVVVPEGRSPAWALLLFSEATGQLPQFQHGAAVWTVAREAPASVWLSARVARPCVIQLQSLAGLENADACLAADFARS
jgi:hypothetical protein